MRRLISLLIVLAVMTQLKAQSTDKLPYHTIPEYPETFTAGTVAARVVDGLGFRYFWATDSLTERDLAFRPSDEARSMLETLEHIFGLSNVIVNSTQLQPNDFSQPREKLGYAEMRKKTLENFQQASEILKTATQSDLEDFKIVFQYPDGNSREYPFWNQLNGPIADAIWHVGQVVTFRRSAGNPINGNVSVLRGTLKTN